MRLSLTHRGPDGWGQELFENAALSHNRLAIIDPASGQQPLRGASGTSWVVFNGEIYNYRELRQGLADYPFRTHSDTEVILALFEREGVSGWRHLRGMFAFALWDELSRTGYLVRDPVGIKPLFYAHHGDKLLFGSEAKALLAGGIVPRLNEPSLHGVMNFRYLPGDDSFFSGIVQLPPGQILTWCQGTVSMTELPRQRPPSGEPLPDLLAAAVKRHLVADVPVGCYLSGGVDSALIAALASREGPLATYTLEVGDDPREAANALNTADLLGLPNRSAPLRIDDGVEIHRSMLRHLEVPKVNALQGMQLADFVARQGKVALSGLGGDELFYGYNAHRIFWLAHLAGSLPASLRHGLTRPLLGRLAPDAWTEQRRGLMMLEALPDWPRVYGLLRNVWDCPELRRQVYGERMLDAALPDAFERVAECWPQEPDPVKAMAAFELRNKMVNDLLWNEDRMGMRVGLEIRVPLLDEDLVDYFLDASRTDLMPLGRAKYALRRCTRQALSGKILRRPKSGFQLDIVALAQGALRPFFETYLSPERIAHHRLFNGTFIGQVMKGPAKRGRRWQWFLLYLMAQAHLLMEEFDVR